MHFRVKQLNLVELWSLKAFLKVVGGSFRLQDASKLTSQHLLTAIYLPTWETARVRVRVHNSYIRC